jgi:Tfp pilus assembly protein PilO
MTGTTRLLVRRIASEHRRFLAPLLIALVVNVIVYALFVYPLSQAVGSIEQREAAATRELEAARKEHAAADGTLSGKDRAARELERFYTEVLPHDLSSARRLTHLRLPQLASGLGLVYDRASSAEPQRGRDSVLTRFQTTVEIAGRYSDIRTFIHQLETAPEFVVIDTVELAEEDEESGRLNLTLGLSTYYRTAAP